MPAGTEAGLAQLMTGVVLPPPPLDEPLDARVVPVVEVLALDEILPVVLAVESTVVLAPVVEAGDSAALELTLDTAEVVLLFAGASAEVEDAGDESAPEVEGINNELPEEADDAAPAPEDDPAVFDAAGVEVLPDGVDWM